MMPKSHAYSESWILCKLLTYLSVASCPWKKAPTSLSRASFKRPLPELLSFKPLGNPTHPLSHTNPIIKMAQLLILPYYLILIFSYVKQWEPGGSRPLSAVECVNVATWYCTYALWYSVLPAESRKSEVPTWISRPWVIVQHTALAKEFFIQRSSPSPLSQELQDKIWGHCEPSPDVAWNKSLCNGDSQKLHLHRCLRATSKASYRRRLVLPNCLQDAKHSEAELFHGTAEVFSRKMLWSDSHRPCLMEGKEWLQVNTIAICVGRTWHHGSILQVNL